MVMMHVWFIGLRRQFGETAGKSMVRPLFLLLGFFCLVGIQGCGFGVLFIWHLWISRAQHPGPGCIEVFNLGGWLTHGDLEAKVDFLAVVEHRLIPARVRSECVRLRKRGWLLSGLQPVRTPLTLGMLVLVSSV